MYFHTKTSTNSIQRANHWSLMSINAFSRTIHTHAIYAWKNVLQRSAICNDMPLIVEWLTVHTCLFWFDCVPLILTSIQTFELLLPSFMCWCELMSFFFTFCERLSLFSFFSSSFLIFSHLITKKIVYEKFRAFYYTYLYFHTFSLFLSENPQLIEQQSTREAVPAGILSLPWRKISSPNLSLSLSLS